MHIYFYLCVLKQQLVFCAINEFLLFLMQISSTKWEKWDTQTENLRKNSPTEYLPADMKHIFSCGLNIEIWKTTAL